MERIKVFETTGPRAVLDTPDGEKIFNKLLTNFEKEEIVYLDFDKVDTILSMFLNSAIAPLYKVYDSEFLNKHLIIENMSDDDKLTLKRVNSRAKQFYREEKENTNLRMEDIYGE